MAASWQIPDHFAARSNPQSDRTCLAQLRSAHIFAAFLAYCLQATLKATLRALAGGTTPREVLAKLKTMQMVEVQLPITDGREQTLSRCTQPKFEHRLLLDQLRLSLPSQPPPKTSAAQEKKPPQNSPCSGDLRVLRKSNQRLGSGVMGKLRKTG